jgi:hypothetical protein
VIVRNLLYHPSLFSLSSDIGCETYGLPGDGYRLKQHALEIWDTGGGATHVVGSKMFHSPGEGKCKAKNWGTDIE